MEFKIISCNARVQTTNDGEQQFLCRADFLARKLLELDADIIGFQETTPLMKIMLAERMPQYAFVGGGRGGMNSSDRLGESPLIAIKQSKFFIERVETEILSKTPLIPGSRYEDSDQSICPRAFVSADIVSLESGEAIRVMNVHTDHIGCKARLLEVSQMIKYYRAADSLRRFPTVITGDFNAKPDAPEIKLMQSEGGFKDTGAHIKSTFHDYDRLTSDTKIDYIFISDGLSKKESYSIHPKDGDLFFSDHDPLIAVIETMG